MRSEIIDAWRVADEAMRPTPPTTIIAKLTPVLALSAGVGMSADDRGEWLAAAATALDGIPADLLAIGIEAARRTADHPSKIVPAINAAVGEFWSHRRDELRMCTRLGAFTKADTVGMGDSIGSTDGIHPSEVAETNRLMRKLGLKQRYRPDGAGYQLERGQPDPAGDAQPGDAPMPADTAVQRHEGPARNPTVNDYVALGVDRETAARFVAERTGQHGAKHDG
ncbi:hypothetical protein SAMN06295912_13622 [Sphingomonas laterariae]|uniref:Uncharacterized protein n=1 Tax=Edaphosphingomonas laterariae TaxID=861865 RepID=A0A239JN21_9SPHN|nr:hypothetical protein SAMN06295912_13622 [Sphingomonas laterariae]